MWSGAFVLQISCFLRRFDGREPRLRRRGDAAIVASGGTFESRSRHRSGAPRRADGGKPLARRVGSFARSAQRHNLSQLVQRGRRGLGRRRRVRPRRPERLHARVDRESLPRADPGRPSRDAAGGERRVQLAVEPARLPGRRRCACCERRPVRRGGAAVRDGQHQPEVHLRLVRDRVLEPLRPRGGARCRRGACRRPTTLSSSTATPGSARTHLHHAVANYVGQHSSKI